MGKQILLKKIQGKILTLTLNRPEAKNAFNLELAQALGKALQEAGKNERIRVVVLRGAGGAFSAGGDIKRFAQSLKKNDQHFRQVFRQLNEAIYLIRTMAKPVIAAITGPAYAAAFGLALSCDLVVATESSRFSPSFINIGLAPNASSTFFLPRLIGVKRAAEAFMRAQVFTAREAHDLGIINHVWPDKKFDPELGKLTKDLCHRPAGTLERIKNLLNSSLGHSWQEQIEMEKEEIALSSLTHDFKEGVTAFVEKRRPHFKP